MKFSINKNFKIWVILTIVIVVVGLAIFGIFGLNKSVDFKGSYEAVVSMDTQFSSTPEEFTGLADEYFASKDIKPAGVSQVLDGPTFKYSVVYKFANDVELDATAMQEYIHGKLSDSSIVVEVEYNYVAPYNTEKYGWTILALAIAAVVITIYLFIMEKFIGGLTVLVSAVLSSLVSLALLAITRIPANSFVAVIGSCSYILASMLSCGLVNRFREENRLNESKEQNANKFTYEEIADACAMSSLTRFCFVLAGLILASLLFIILGGAYVKVAGLQLLVIAISAVYASLVGATVIWPLLNKQKKIKA